MENMLARRASELRIAQKKVALGRLYLLTQELDILSDTRLPASWKAMET